MFKDREAFKSEQSRDKNALLETVREAQKLLPKGKKVSREQFKGVKEKLNLDAPHFTMNRKSLDKYLNKFGVNK